MTLDKLKQLLALAAHTNVLVPELDALNNAVSKMAAFQVSPCSCYSHPWHILSSIEMDYTCDDESEASTVSDLPERGCERST